MTTVLQEANNLVDGDRQDAYGHPADNAERFAVIASVVTGLSIEPHHLADLMLCLKLSRIPTTGRFHRDTYVDIAGYARLREIIHERAEES